MKVLAPKPLDLTQLDLEDFLALQPELKPGACSCSPSAAQRMQRAQQLVGGAARAGTGATLDHRV